MAKEWRKKDIDYKLSVAEGKNGKDTKWKLVFIKIENDSPHDGGEDYITKDVIGVFDTKEDAENYFREKRLYESVREYLLLEMLKIDEVAEQYSSSDEFYHAYCDSPLSEIEDFWDNCSIYRDALYLIKPVEYEVLEIGDKEVPKSKYEEPLDGSEKEKVWSAKIGDDTETISDRAFLRSLLLSVFIGKNVKLIGAWAFSWCRFLHSIEFGGTIAEWQAVKKGMSWCSCSAATVVKCADGEVKL